MAGDISKYISRVTQRHSNKPKFINTIASLVQPLADNQVVSDALATTIFDLDTAVGIQLDQVGKWVGRTRDVVIPLNGVYFSFDTTGLGWDQGSWLGPFDPTTGVVSLDDTTYRALLRARIIINSWDGSATQALAALNKIFSLSPGTFITITDNGDMTMTVGISGIVPPAILISMLQNGEFNVRPDGVGINYFITSVNTTPVFGFDIETSAVAGWDVGSWAGTPGSGAPPGQINQFSLVFVSTNSAAFSWVAPTVGSNLTYQLTIASNSAGPYQSAGLPVNVTNGTVTGLLAGTTYFAEVYAVNSGGAGAASPPLQFTTNLGIPGQVTGLAEVSSTTTSITLVWNSVPNAVSYQVQYRVFGTTTFTNGPNITQTSVAVTGLLPATTYDFQVFAINTIGQGPTSLRVTLGTVGSTPGVVTNVVTIAGIADIAITWSNPTTGNGPFAFTVQYALNITPPLFQTFTGTQTLTATGGSCDITGLQQNTSYLIQIAASNAGGNGPYITPVVSSTTSGPPNQVTGLTTSSISPTSVGLTWGAVTNAVTYQIQYKNIGSTVWLNGPQVTAPTTSGTVSSLSPGVTYDFRVYAIGP